MTTTPPNADELVSAYLDGEAAPDEIRTVESSPELLARVAALRSLGEQLAATPPAPTAVKSAHISAALDLFDELQGQSSAQTDDPTAAPAAVRSLDQARERRRPRRVNALAAAAAAIAVVFIGITALSLTSSNSDDLADATTSAEPVTAAARSSDAADLAPADADAAGDDAAELEEPAEAFAEAVPPAPTGTAGESLAQAAPAPLADEAGAADDAMDSEEAADEADGSVSAEPADEPAAGDAPGVTELDGVELENSLFYLGRFTEPQALALELEARTFIEPEIFELPTCQSRVGALAGAEEPTLVALATLNDRPVEIHQVPGETTQLIVDRSTCRVIDELTG